MTALTRFLGDTPLRIVLKLVVISFLVGVLMMANVRDIAWDAATVWGRAKAPADYSASLRASLHTRSPPDSGVT